ncbi:hypothetical protein [Streptomyces sp. NPDC058374]|uniref:hypothetical protein n=1 Tax=Streptomyces sp. NPDC058374 TaxID=3346466 RepID=UPI00364FD338
MSSTDGEHSRAHPRTPAEPALRPVATSGPGVEISVWARLFFDGKALVLRSRGFFGQRREVRYPLSGPRGVSRALLIIPDAETTDPGNPGVGEVRFLDPAGRPVARLPINRWLSPGGRRLPIEEQVRRSGVYALLEAAGIPVEPASQADRAAPRESWWRELLLALDPGPTLPWWYQALRVVAGCVWFLAFSVVLFSDTALPGWVLLAAVTAFVAPVARLVIRGVTALRNRSAARLDPPPLIEVSPCPGPPDPGAEHTVPTRRFTSRAALRVYPGELSVVDPYGADVRRPLNGPAAPRALIRVVAADGTPVGVHLRYASGADEPVVAWADWFGGPGGDQAWHRFRKAVKLPCEDHKVSAKALSGPSLIRGPGAVIPSPDPKQARRAALFPPSAAGVSSTAVTGLGSYLSVQMATTVVDDAPGIARLAVLLGLSGLLLQFAPWCWHHLRSRLYFERPVARKDQAS